MSHTFGGDDEMGIRQILLNARWRYTTKSSARSADKNSLLLCRKVDLS
jgi:hypothetical protein